MDCETVNTDCTVEGKPIKNVTTEEATLDLGSEVDPQVWQKEKESERDTYKTMGKCFSL